MGEPMGSQVLHSVYNKNFVYIASSSKTEQTPCDEAPNEAIIFILNASVPRRNNVYKFSTKNLKSEF